MVYILQNGDEDITGEAVISAQPAAVIQRELCIVHTEGIQITLNKLKTVRPFTVDAALCVFSGDGFNQAFGGQAEAVFIATVENIPDGIREGVHYLEVGFLLDVLLDDLTADGDAGISQMPYQQIGKQTSRPFDGQVKAGGLIEIAADRDAIGRCGAIPADGAVAAGDELELVDKSQIVVVGIHSQNGGAGLSGGGDANAVAVVIKAAGLTGIPLIKLVGGP